MPTFKNISNNTDFACIHCGAVVSTVGPIGTHNRNHCPHCLWSKHVDDVSAGDRKSLCHAGMEPVGLTFKNIAADKYGRPRVGELMLIHRCTKDGKISINRIAADDSTAALTKIFEQSLLTPVTMTGVRVLGEQDRGAVKQQLFGKA